MDEFEKVEKLKNRANVTYEEARDALNASGGDLLDAMVYLEKSGRVKGPDKSTYSTNVDDKTDYQNVPNVVQQQSTNNSDPSFGDSLGMLIKTAFQKSVTNYLVVFHRDKEKFRVPVLLFIIALLFGNMGLLIVITVSLFFGVRYRFVGQDDLSKVNDFMDQAGNKAVNWMDNARAQKNNEDNSTNMNDRQDP